MKITEGSSITYAAMPWMAQWNNASFSLSHFTELIEQLKHFFWICQQQIKPMWPTDWWTENTVTLKTCQQPLAKLSSSKALMLMQCSNSTFPSILVWKISFRLFFLRIMCNFDKFSFIILHYLKKKKKTGCTIVGFFFVNLILMMIRKYQQSDVHLKCSFLDFKYAPPNPMKIQTFSF